MQTSNELHCTHCGIMLTRGIHKLNGFSDLSFCASCQQFLFLKDIDYDFQYKRIIYNEKQFNRLNWQEKILYFKSHNVDFLEEVQRFNSENRIAMPNDIIIRFKEFKGV